MPRSKSRPSAAKKQKKSSPSSHGASTSAATPDERAARDLAIKLMGIPGTSGQEGAVQKFVIDALRSAGVPSSAITVDQVNRKSPIGGECGNLVVKLPGTLRAPRRLLMAHLDTVPLCVGSRPVRKGKVVHSADKSTGLGADNRAGCAVVLTAAREIMQHKLPHPPLTLFWAVQEEVGLHGARLVSHALLGRPKLAFNWDGGVATKLTIGATGAYRMRIVLEGLASHAGNHPELGVSAVTIAGLAISNLEAGGWLGAIQQGKRSGTSNIGVVRGGAATNFVTDRLELMAEARSHDPKFRGQILKAFERAFRKAAAKVRNIKGTRGRATVESRLDYDSYCLSPSEPCVAAATQAVRSAGGEPELAIANGGLDANWMTARGLPTVSLGCGQRAVHTTGEELDLDEFAMACRIGLRLATATEC